MKRNAGHCRAGLRRRVGADAVAESLVCAGRSTRRALLRAAVAWLALASTRAARAQQPRLPKIGYLLLTPLIEPPTPERRAFLDGLKDYGYVPGKTIEIVYASAENERDFLDAMSADLVKQNVDVIVTSGMIALGAAQKATRTIPIVMLAIGDPVGTGVTSSLAKPDQNITGMSFISSDLAGKRVQLVKEMAPATKRIAVLWDSRNPNARAEYHATIAAAKSLGIAAESVAVARDGELWRALDQARARKSDALYVAFEGGLVASNRTMIAEYGRRHRLPVVSGWSSLTEAGGLLSYGTDIAAVYRRAAYYVHRILKGAKPGELPIEQPTKFELVINLKTAKVLGIKIPNSILVSADKVIE